MQQTEKQQKEKEPVKKRFKKLRTGRIGEENLENKVLDEDFSLLWISTRLIHKTFIQSDTHTLHVGVCFCQHRSIHTETYCTSFHLILQGKTSGGGENVNAEQVESSKEEADKLIFEHLKQTVNYGCYPQTYCVFHVIRKLNVGGGDGQPFPSLFL